MFRLPAELREMVYREALIAPHGSPLRTFSPPALLHSNKRLRNEALPVFYGENNFEITVKRSPEDEALAAERRLPSVDIFVWRRFLRMLDVFNCFGSNCLRHVRNVTLIYQLSMEDGQTFGHNEFDRRLGFRFSSDEFEDNRGGDHVEDRRGEDKNGPDDSHAESEIEAADPETEGPGGEDPDADTDPVGFFELNRGTLNLRSLREAHYFLFHRTCEYGNVYYRIKGSLEERQAPAPPRTETSTLPLLSSLEDDTVEGEVKPAANP